MNETFSNEETQVSVLHENDIAPDASTAACPAWDVWLGRDRQSWVDPPEQKGYWSHQRKQTHNVPQQVIELPLSQFTIFWPLLGTDSASVLSLRVGFHQQSRCNRGNDVIALKSYITFLSQTCHSLNRCFQLCGAESFVSLAENDNHLNQM